MVINMKLNFFLNKIFSIWIEEKENVFVKVKHINMWHTESKNGRFCAGFHRKRNEIFVVAVCSAHTVNVTVN